MSLPLRMRLFKNKNKEKGDNKPPYSNSKFTVQEDITLKAGVAYQCGLWKDENHDALNLRVDEKKEFGNSQGGGGMPTQVHDTTSPSPEEDIPF